MVIEVENFSKSFDKRQVHRSVSFSLNRGECLGLLGGSGIGKSVILRSLIGLEKPDGGDIRVEGESIVGKKERDLVTLRKKVAYVFQNGALFDSMNVFNNLAYPLREHTQLSETEIRDKVIGQLAEFGMNGSENKFPSQLSGGMQKRVGLARAIILGPKIVLYDEPTAGLDPYNTVMIQEMILRLKSKGVSSILVTHDMPTAIAVCDRIALLMGGVIKAIGTIDEMKEEEQGPLQKFIRGEQV